MADPNWLLSTMAQSAAAIVGLVGGFLINKLLGLSAEKNALISQLSENQNEINFNHQLLKEYERQIKEEGRKLYGQPITQKYNDLVFKKNNVSYQIDYLNTQKMLIEKKIRYYGEPKGVTPGAIILLFLTLFGVILPVVMMPVERLPQWQKHSIITLFVIGLFLVLGYICYIIIDTTKKIK